MNSKMALLVLALGVALASGSLLANKIAPEMARVTLITGLAGGLLCALWATMAFLSFRQRTGVVLTLIAINLVLLTQAIGGWVDRVLGRSQNVLALGIMTAMLAASIGVLVYVLHAGNNKAQSKARE